MPLPDINQRTTQRTRVLPRRVANPARHMDPSVAGRGFGSLAAAFGKFAGKLQQEEEQARMLEDEKALASLAVSVNERPDDAWNAVRTGDYSGFVDEQQAGRMNFMRFAPLTIAEALASREALSFSNKLKTTGPETNASALAKKYLDDTLKGLPPRAALKFQETFTKGIAGTLKDRQAAMEKLQQAKLKSTMVPTLTSGLKTGSISSLADLNKLTYLIAQGSGNVVEGLVSAQTQADEVVGRLSASADPEIAERAQALLYAPNPERGGSSIADRLGPGKVASLQAAQEKAWYRHIGKQASESFASAQEMLAAGKNPAQVHQWLSTQMGRLGVLPETPEYVQARTLIHKKIQSDIAKADTRSRPTTSARDGGWSPTDLGNEMEDMLDRGENPLTSSRFMELAAHTETPKAVRRQLRAAMVSGDVRKMAEARIFIRTVMKSGKYGISNYLDDKMAQAVFFATENSQTQDGVEMQQRITERLQDRGGEWHGAAFETVKAFNLLDDDALRSKGAVEQGLLQFIWGPDMKDLRTQLGMGDIEFKDLSAELRQQHSVRLLDVAAIAAGASDQPTNESIAQAYLGMFKDDFELGKLGSDGRPKWTKRRTPSLVTDAGGTYMRYKGAGPKESAEFVAKVKEAGLDKKLGYTSDDVTERDGSVLMMADLGAGMQEFSLKAGTTISLPEEMVGNLGLNGFFEQGDDPNRPGNVLVTPVAPGKTFTYRGQPTNFPATMKRIDNVGDGGYLQWDDAQQTWELRRHLGSATKIPTKAQSEAAITRANKEIQKGIRGLETRITERLKDNQYWDSANGTLGYPEGDLMKLAERFTQDTKTFTNQEALEEARANLQEVEDAIIAHRAKEAGLQDAQLPARVITQALAANDPLTMTEEALMEALTAKDEDGRPKVLKGSKRYQSLMQALKQRKQGVDPVAPESLIPEKAQGPGFSAIDKLSPTQRDNYNEKVQEAITKALVDGVNNGSYHPSVLGVADVGAANVAQALKKAEDITRRAGGSTGTHLEGGAMTPFMTDVVNFIARSEGFVETPTKDPGANQLNIGHGFYTGRPEAEAAMSAAGISEASLKSGKPISKEQAAILTSFAVATHEKWLRKTFEGFPLKDHQKKALHSFIYSSRWKNGNPTVMGPQIISAIKSGNHGRVAEIIRNTLKVADPNANIRQGMMNRRNREARMYLGTSRLSVD